MLDKVWILKLDTEANLLTTSFCEWFLLGQLGERAKHFKSPGNCYKIKILWLVKRTNFIWSLYKRTQWSSQYRTIYLIYHRPWSVYILQLFYSKVYILFIRLIYYCYIVWHYLFLKTFYDFLFVMGLGLWQYHITMTDV